MHFNFKHFMALLFSIIFKAISLVLVVFAVYKSAYVVAYEQKEFVTAVIESVNAFIISLAIFELGVGVGKEYTSDKDDGNLYLNVRRTITRFVGTVCIALVLESLIMIIKYSQLELAGNLFYPVGIIAGSSLLLMSLGVFLRLTKGHTE